MNKFKFDKNTSSLFRAISSLENVREMESFFRDLCTLEEIKSMSDRWAIARLLNSRLSYRKIAKNLSVSTTTVSRVAFWFNEGEGGYKCALNKINLHHNSSKIYRKS